MIRWITAMNTRDDILFPYVPFLDAFELVKIPVESESHDISTTASRPTEMHSKGLFTEYTKPQSHSYNATVCLSFDVLTVIRTQTPNFFWSWIEIWLRVCETIYEPIIPET